MINQNSKLKTQNVIPAKAGIQSAVIPMKIGISVRLFAIFAVAFLSLAGVVFGARPAWAGYCFCAVELESQKAGDIGKIDATKNSGCIENIADEGACKVECLEQGYKEQDSSFYDEEFGLADCKDAQVYWEKTLAKLQGDVANSESDESSGKFLPKCITNNDLSPGSPCRDVGIFVILGINVANYLFAIIGALALLMFIYGGFMFIISEGNPERVKKGTDAMLAAVIGIVVVFSAYLLVGFLGEVVDVSTKFRIL